MPEDVLLTGYRFSVYTWIARLTLTECGVDYRYREVGPFAPGRSLGVVQPLRPRARPAPRHLRSV